MQWLVGMSFELVGSEVSKCPSSKAVKGSHRSGEILSQARTTQHPCSFLLLAVILALQASRISILWLHLRSLDWIKLARNQGSRFYMQCKGINPYSLQHPCSITVLIPGSRTQSLSTKTWKLSEWYLALQAGSKVGTKPSSWFQTLQETCHSKAHQAWKKKGKYF